MSGTQFVGANTAVLTAGTTTDGLNALFKLGAEMTLPDGSVWVYGQAGEAISQYMAVAIDEAGQMFKLTSALALNRHLIGFAQSAFNDNDLGWVMVSSGQNNTYKVGVLSATDSAKMLSTSGTAGYLGSVYSTFVPLLGVMIAVTLATTGGATCVVKKPVETFLRTSGV